MYRIFYTLPVILILAACAGNTDANETGGEVANAKPEHIPGYWMEYSEKGRYDAANSGNAAQACTAFSFSMGKLTPVKAYEPMQIDNDGNMRSCRNINGLSAPLDFQCLENKGKVDVASGKVALANGCTVKISANSAAALISGMCNGNSDSMHLFRATEEGVQRYTQTAIDCYAKLNQSP